MKLRRATTKQSVDCAMLEYTSVSHKLPSTALTKLYLSITLVIRLGPYSEDYKINNLKTSQK